MQMLEWMISSDSVQRIRDTPKNEVNSRHKSNDWESALRERKRNLEYLNRSRSESSLFYSQSPKIHRSNTVNNIIYSSVEKDPYQPKFHNKLPKTFFNPIYPDYYKQHKRFINHKQVYDLKRSRNKNRKTKPAPWENSTFKYNPLHCDTSEVEDCDQRFYNFEHNNYHQKLNKKKLKVKSYLTYNRTFLRSIERRSYKPNRYNKNNNKEIDPYKYNFRLYPKNDMIQHRNIRQTSYKQRADSRHRKNSNRKRKNYSKTSMNPKIKVKRLKYHKNMPVIRQMDFYPNYNPSSHNEMNSRSNKLYLNRSQSLTNLNRINDNNIVYLKKSRSLISFDDYISKFNMNNYNNHYNENLNFLNLNLKNNQHQMQYYPSKNSYENNFKSRPIVKSPKHTKQQNDRHKRKQTNKAANKSKGKKKKSTNKSTGLFSCFSTKCCSNKKSKSKSKKEKKLNDKENKYYNENKKYSDTLMKKMDYISNGIHIPAHTQPNMQQVVAQRKVSIDPDVLHQQNSLKLFKKRKGLNDQLFNTDLSRITTGQNQYLNSINNDFTTVTSIMVPKTNSDCYQRDSELITTQLYHQQSQRGLPISFQTGLIDSNFDKFDDTCELKKYFDNYEPNYDNYDEDDKHNNIMHSVEDLIQLDSILDSQRKSHSEPQMISYNTNSFFQDYIQNADSQDSELKNDAKMPLLQSKSKTKPKRKQQNEQINSTNKSKTLIPLSNPSHFTIINNHLTEIKNLFKESKTNLRRNVTDLNMKGNLHDWAVWRAKFNETLIKTCFTASNLKKSIDTHNEINLKNDSYIEPSFVFYSSLYGSNTNLNPEAFMLFGLPRVRLSPKTTSTAEIDSDEPIYDENSHENPQEHKNFEDKHENQENLEDDNDLDPTTISRFKTTSRSNSEPRIITGINVKEKIKVFESTNNLNQESLTKLIRQKSNSNLNEPISRNNSKPSSINQDSKQQQQQQQQSSQKSQNKSEQFTKTATMLSSSLTNSSEFVSPPLPGHLCEENKRDRSTDADLKRDINVNSLLIKKTPPNAESYNEDKNRSNEFIETNHFFSQDPEKHIVLMSMPNEHITTSTTKSSKQKSKPIDVLKAVDGDIIFHKPSKSSTNSFESTKTKQIMNGLKKNIGSQEDLNSKSVNQSSEASGSNTIKKKLKEKLIKNEKYNYLSPLKNMLRSKTKQQKVEDIRNAAHDAVEAALSPIQPNDDQIDQKQRRKVKEHKSNHHNKAKKSDINQTKTDTLTKHKTVKQTSRPKETINHEVKTEKLKQNSTQMPIASLKDSQRQKTKVKIRTRSSQMSKKHGTSSTRSKHKSKVRKQLPIIKTDRSNSRRRRQFNLTSTCKTVQNNEYFTNNEIFMASSLEHIEDKIEDIIDLTSSSASSSLLSLKSSSSSCSSSDDELKLGLIPKSKLNLTNNYYRRFKKYNTETVLNQDGCSSNNKSSDFELNINKTPKVYKAANRQILFGRKDTPPPIVQENEMIQRKLKEKKEKNSSGIINTTGDSSFQNIKIKTSLVQPPPPSLPPPSLIRFNQQRNETVLNDRSNDSHDSKKNFKLQTTRTTSYSKQLNENESTKLDLTTSYLTKEDSSEDLNQTITIKKNQAESNKMPHKTNETFMAMLHESASGKKKGFRRIKMSNNEDENIIRSKFEYDDIEEKQSRGSEFKRYHHEIEQKNETINSDNNNNSNRFKLIQSRTTNFSKIKSEDYPNLFKLPPLNKTMTRTIESNGSTLNTSQIKNATYLAHNNNNNNNLECSILSTTTVSNSRTRPKTSKEILQEISRLTNGTTPSYRLSSSNHGTLGPNHQLNSTDLDASFLSNTKMFVNRDMSKINR